MSLSPDRRNLERRTEPKLGEPLERTKDRRGDDRRDAPRVRRELSVLEEGRERLEVLGHLALNGASWYSPFQPSAESVELRFRLPDVLEPVCVRCSNLRTEPREDGFDVHATFPALDIRHELALARFLEERSKLAQSMTE